MICPTFFFFQLPCGKMYSILPPVSLPPWGRLHQTCGTNPSCAIMFNSRMLEPASVSHKLCSVLMMVTPAGQLSTRSQLLLLQCHESRRQI